MKLGTTEFDKLIESLNICWEKGEDSTLNVVILPNKEIWVLPFRFPEGQKSQHSIVAKGNPCAWAGEVKIKGNQIRSINDKSGHFKTLDFDDKVQKAISDFALQTFRDQGYNVPSAVALTLKSRSKDLASLVSAPKRER